MNLALIAIAGTLLFAGCVAGAWAIFEKDVSDGAREYQRYLDKVFRLKMLAGSMVVVAWLCAEVGGAYPPMPNYALVVIIPAVLVGLLIARVQGLNEVLTISTRKMEIFTAVMMGIIMVTVFWKYFPIAAG